MTHPVDIVRAHYDAIARRDRAALMATLADDVDWQMVAPNTLPIGGNFHGHAGAQRFFATIAGACEFIEFKVERMIVEGDTVVALGRERVKVRATGREWASEWVQVHTVRDGAIRRFREYTDSAAIAAAFA